MGPISCHFLRSLRRAHKHLLRPFLHHVFLSIRLGSIAPAAATVAAAAAVLGPRWCKDPPASASRAARRRPGG